MSELTDDDALAAEYVIGTLSAEEMRGADERRRRDPAFAGLIDAWSARMSPLLEAVPAVEPDSRLREAVMGRIARLHGTPIVATETTNVVRLRRQVTLWRTATGLCASLAALLAIWIATARFLPTTDRNTYVAVLQQGSGAPAFLVSLDLATKRMTVVPQDTAAGPDKSYELWMIGADSSGPRPIGLVDSPTPVRAALPDVSPDLISTATYAITVEPKGGSPSGKPSAAPVFVGRLVPMNEPR